uniref:Spermidine synthase n=1 Tax=Trypanosoma congolense (strain IL3000) TaxID=1068625 RepID=G0UW09_TRYCI|nr:conserved hypothetical protein [Trypanosoma congolense IL3000]
MSNILKPRSYRSWGFIFTGVGGLIAIGVLSGAAHLRQRRVPLFDEADVVAVEEHARYPCRTFRGYDVVVKNHYVRTTGEGRHSSASLWGSTSPIGSFVAAFSARFCNRVNTVVGPEDPLAEKNQLHLVREFVGDAHAPPKPPQCGSGSQSRMGSASDTARVPAVSPPPMASSTWPAGTTKYTSLSIETSAGENVSDVGTLIHQWTNRVTQQSLVRCDPLAPASVNCFADATYLSAPYLRVMLSAFLLLPSPLPRLRVAVLGVGGGSLPSFLQQYFSRDITRLDLVDAEQQCFHAAVEDMGMRKTLPGGTVTCHVSDGVDFLRRVARPPSSGGRGDVQVSSAIETPGTSVVFGSTARPEVESHHQLPAQQPSHVAKHYDILFVDLFVGSDLPDLVLSSSFLHLCHGALSSIGVAAFNLPKSNPDFVRRCGQVFGPQNVYQIPVPASANIVVLVRRAATSGAGTAGCGCDVHLARRHFYNRARQLQKSHKIPYDLAHHYPVWWCLW